MTLAFSRCSTLLSLALVLLPLSVLGKESETPSFAAGIEGATSFYGFSGSLFVSKRFAPALWAKIELEQGSFSFLSPAGKGFLGFPNLIGFDTNVHVDIRSIVSVLVSLQINGESEFRFLDSVGLGLSECDLQLTETFQNYQGNSFTGIKPFSTAAICGELGFLDYHPSGAGLDFRLGMRGNCGFINGPLYNYFENNSGQVVGRVQYGQKNDLLLFPFLELFLGTSYAFN
ncbi:MAG TPA: hypothetical protein VMV05_00260 [bacterium]|nr:hypothetical protein [bacterium]